MLGPIAASIQPRRFSGAAPAACNARKQLAEEAGPCFSAAVLLRQFPEPRGYHDFCSSQKCAFVIDVTSFAFRSFR